MNEKDAIIQKIIQDARDYADKVLSDAQTKASGIWAEAESGSENALINGEKQCAEERAAYLARRQTLARLESKKTLLSAKRAVLDEVFARAQELLTGMSEEEYLAYISARLETYAAEGDRVILSENAPVTAEKVAGLPAAKNKKLKAYKNGKFSGGIILEGKNTDYDFSFEGVLRDYAEKYSGEISRSIFKENER